METNSKKVLIIGGRGKIAQLATRMLVDANAAVTSLVRTEDSAPEVERLGAAPLVRDLTGISHDEWVDLLADFDAVVWSAGNGGRGGADVTYAVDRDGAVAVIDALSDIDIAPRFITVSYAGAPDNTAEDDGGTWYAYVESKKAADRHLMGTELEYLILAPAALTDEPARGIEVVDHVPGAAKDRTTSRELVAEVIADAVLRPSLPSVGAVAFVDGDEEFTSAVLSD